jgi:two-component system KDP operon response regulator KdpE
MIGKSETILIIEDETPIRRFLKASLSTQQFKIVETQSGAEGLALAASHNPKLILLDLGLPDI